MNNPTWWSQPMRPEGDQTGSGIKDQLGRPGLGEYAVLVREAVQNSWDARRGDGPVTVTFTVARLGDLAPNWIGLLGPENSSHKLECLSRDLNPDTYILLVSDRGTVGLGGAIRSDKVQRGKNSNFVQFMRNVGEARDTQLGGGTYGFGKGIFYRVSQASTILVDSKNNEPGAANRRLMGAALTDSYSNGMGQRFTGRHWWGKINENIPDPVLNEHAGSLAEKLGLPGFSAHETGTDVAIIQPDITLENPEETIATLGERIRSHIYWHLWPKFRTDTRPDGIDFRVIVNGADLEMPPITSVPILNAFSSSLDKIEKGEGSAFSLKKHKDEILGEFGTEYVFPIISKPATDTQHSIHRLSPIAPPYKHVARMRQAELIVDYLPGPESPSTDFGYVGSFRASTFADQFFAAAEPPTHDTWSTARLTGSSLGAVRSSKAFILEHCRQMNNGQTGADTTSDSGLGRLAGDLGSFVYGAAGTRARYTATKGSRAQRSSQKSPTSPVRLVANSRVRLLGNSAVVETEIEVPNSPGKTAKHWQIAAVAHVLLAHGRREKRGGSPIGSEEPRFLGWYYQNETTPRYNSPEISLTQLIPGRWRSQFKFMAGAALQIEIGSVPNV